MLLVYTSLYAMRVVLAFFYHNFEVRNIARRIDMLVLAKIRKVDLDKWQLIVWVIDSRWTVNTLRCHCWISLQPLKLGDNFFSCHGRWHVALSFLFRMIPHVRYIYYAPFMAKNLIETSINGDNRPTFRIGVY